MINLLKNRTSILKIYLWGTIAFISNLVLKLWTVPEIRNKTNGFTSFDLSIKGYNLSYATDYIKQMDETIINFYSHVQIPIDIIFPVSTAIFSLLLLAFINNKISVKKIFYILPILCCIFDLIENLLIYTMLNYNLNTILVKVSSSLTQLKFFTGILYGIIIIFLFIKFRKPNNR